MTKHTPIANAGSNTAVMLADLARRINAEHEATEIAMQSGLEHAIKAGELLLEAKEAVPHGNWLPWLKANCSVSERTAQLYMKVAREREALGAESASLADLTLEQAARRLSKPKPPALPDSPSSDPQERLHRFLNSFPPGILEETDGKDFNILTKPQLLVDAVTFYNGDATEAAERMHVSFEAFFITTAMAFKCGYKPLRGYPLRVQIICTRFCVAGVQEVLDELGEYHMQRDEQELQMLSEDRYQQMIEHEGTPPG